MDICTADGHGPRYDCECSRRNVDGPGTPSSFTSNINAQEAAGVYSLEQLVYTPAIDCKTPNSRADSVGQPASAAESVTNSVMVIIITTVSDQQISHVTIRLSITVKRKHKNICSAAITAARGQTRRSHPPVLKYCGLYLSKSNHFCRAMLCISAAYAYLSVRPSVCHVCGFCRHE